jgi:hypothetical protein
MPPPDYATADDYAFATPIAFEISSMPRLPPIFIAARHFHWFSAPLPMRSHDTLTMPASWPPFGQTRHYRPTSRRHLRHINATPPPPLAIR